MLQWFSWRYIFKMRYKNTEKLSGHVQVYLYCGAKSRVWPVLWHSHICIKTKGVLCFEVGATISAIWTEWNVNIDCHDMKVSRLKKTCLLPVTTNTIVLCKYRKKYMTPKYCHPFVLSTCPLCLNLVSPPPSLTSARLCDVIHWLKSPSKVLHKICFDSYVNFMQDIWRYLDMALWVSRWFVTDACT